MSNEPTATDIYERLEMNASKQGGSVMSDLADIIADGDFDAFEDYFGDLDPLEFM